jgi:MerR family transcriptional regulator, heat shock protein HspR
MHRRRARGRKADGDNSFPKYSIAVAADLSGVAQQQLRRMEESGLVMPSRTQGNTRRYSDADLDQIATVAELSEAGINAAGIRAILALRAELATLAVENARLRGEIEAQRRGEPISTDVAN